MIAIVNHVEASTDMAGVRRTLGEVFRAVTRKPRSVPSTEVRQHFSGALEWVSETDRPLIVMNHGKPEAVILSFGAFERLAKGIAQAVLALGSKRSGLSQQAEDVLEEEGAALARRFRQGGVG
jgi:prevent-host-death family protein